MLGLAGADVWRVGFNAGDRAFWFDPASYIPYRGAQEDWPDHFETLVAEKGITDIVLYGDTRGDPFASGGAGTRVGGWKFTFLRKAICAPIG